jgi:hypothetical protein
MQPYGRLSLAELAVMDPVAAYGRLLGITTKPVTMNAIASFSSLAIGQLPVRVPLDQTITKRTWVDNLAFEIQLPNAFVGNIFLPQALATMKASPGISVRTTVMSGPRYLVSDTFTPIENYVNLINSDWTTGWQIYKFQQVQTEFMLTAIPFNDSSNTPPYNVTLTYNGWQFDDGTCDEISCDEAISELIKAEVVQAKQICGKRVLCPTN